MNYQEALKYLYSLSDFERTGTYTRNLEENLLREARLLELLGNPQRDYTSTLIAGTKGKGSTAAFIERVLRQAGLRTGLYTQPDLHTFRERIRVDGQLIREQDMAKLLTEIQAVVKTIEERREFGPFITYEIATSLAFLYFSRKQVNHAVLEVGLGGRLDATNVVQPLVSVITSISYDHMQILGNTLTQIATEKAGIIKPHGIVVTSAQSSEALLVIALICRQREAQLIRVGPFEADAAQLEVNAGQLPPCSYTYRLEKTNAERQWLTVQSPEYSYKRLEIPLLGQHQLENATTALATLEQLRTQGIQGMQGMQGIVWNEGDLRAGFRNVHWPARMEVIGHNPAIVVDGAHNADSMQKLIQTLHSSFSFHRLIVVLSVASDKDLGGIVQALAKVDTVIVTRMHSPRVASLENLETLFATYAPSVKVYTAPDSGEAMESALNMAGNDDLICATGSLYLAGEVLRWSADRGNNEVGQTIEGRDH